MRTFTMFLLVWMGSAFGQVLDKQAMMDRQTFWDNRDWPWYQANIPFLETPDADIDTTWYYRWELVTKHLVYGSPETGYVYTEFTDRPFWSGRYGAISCAAGHHLYEVRWLKDRRYSQDYSKYWFRTEGAQARRYSTWLADSVLAIAMVQGDQAFAADLLDDLIKHYKGWEQKHWVDKVGMFWQVGHDDGMEFNIDSRQTKNILAGAPSYRPSFNAYMYADARAIAAIARRAGKEEISKEYTAKADALRDKVQEMLWDNKRQFFFPVYKNDEVSKEGDVVKAMTKTYESGKFAGSDKGRQEIGFVPWQFDLPQQGKGYEVAWKTLMDPQGFFAPFGPMTVERNDPMFYLSKSCCWWSGMSWPYATTQTLAAMANLLDHYQQDAVTRDDYFKLLKIYTMTHRKNGKPYIAEACHPETGSWDGHDGYNHSEHYFHSGYCDLIVTGLVGLRPRNDDTIEVNPLAPTAWDYFCLDDIAYRGRRVSIVWDKTGNRYKKGAGLSIWADGKEIARADRLQRLSAALPAVIGGDVPRKPRPLNYAVNNDGLRFPRPIASHTSEHSELAKLNDGQYWYTISPPNRWTAEGSASDSDWCGIDFGTPRPIHTVKLCLLDDGKTVVAPRTVVIESWDGSDWKSVPGQKGPDQWVGHRASTITFPAVQASRIRAVLTHADNGRSGVSEFEAWGDGTLPVTPAPQPPPSLATNPTGKGFPKASASFTSKFDKIDEVNDGKVVFTPNPRNRWTSYESKNPTDWVEIDFGKEVTAARAELSIYDDRGGVRAPQSYLPEYWTGSEWKACERLVFDPKKPGGGRINTVTHTPVKTSKFRIVFTHRDKSRSGLTELEVWPE